MIQILSAIHHMTTMMFGIFISAFMLDVRQNRKNVLVLSGFFCCDGLLFLIILGLSDHTIANQLYPLIVHLPLIVFLTLYYCYPILSSWLSTLSAYLFCQVSNWVGLLVLTITDEEWCYYTARIITTIITFILLSCLVCRTTSAVFAKDRRSLYIFGFLPLVYYVFDYISTKFSSLLYSGNKAVVEFMGFIFCISYVVFLLVYFREYEKKQEISQYNALMEMQLSSLQNEIEQVHLSEKTLSILRHDMRHHLNILLTQLQNGNTDQAMDYIRRINDAYNETIITAYCKNDMVNSVISIYQTRFSLKSMQLICDISIGEHLPCSEIAFCAILSNALENAMHALEKNDPAKKWATLSLSCRDKNLLLRLENPTSEPPRFVDGIPVSDKNDHGIGVKSIIYYVNQLNGQYHFSLSGNSFVLRIII